MRPRPLVAAFMLWAATARGDGDTELLRTQAALAKAREELAAITKRRDEEEARLEVARAEVKRLTDEAARLATAAKERPAAAPVATSEQPPEVAGPRGAHHHHAAATAHVVISDGGEVELRPPLTFAPRRKRIRSPFHKGLKELARLLVRERGVKALWIEGYSDPDSDSAFNRRLSRLRADEVQRYLHALGVSPARMRVLGADDARAHASAPGGDDVPHVLLYLERDDGAPTAEIAAQATGTAPAPLR
jgi:outer membrane protein OmpA-like peptidoglycan-associated protein